MMRYLVINTDKYNYNQFPNGTFYAIPILRGTYKGKFAAFDNAADLFPQIFDHEEYETVELDELDFKVDTTPPDSSGLGVVIPEKYLLPFDDNVFKLGGFSVPLLTIGADKVVDLCYFFWPDFRAELDRKNTDGTFVHEDFKRALMPLWDYVLDAIQNNNTVTI